MSYVTWLADAHREFGCRVVEVDNWRTRGSSTFAPRGVILHHTAGSATGDFPSLRILINGRKGLPGPLCNIGISRSGIVYIIAAGRANHGGTGGWKGLSGNSSVFGIEPENTGLGEPWSDALMDAYRRSTAAMLAGVGQDASYACGHREWTTRKPDPNGIDLNRFRADVANLLLNPAPAPGEEDMASIIQFQGTNPQGPTPDPRHLYALSGRVKSRIQDEFEFYDLVSLGQLQGGQKAIVLNFQSSDPAVRSRAIRAAQMPTV